MTTSANFDVLLQKSARCLEQVFVQRAADVAGFVATEYSFEGWVACEWAAACRRSGFVVSPEPRYARAKATATGRADLLLGLDGTELLVELAVLHDGTLRKWLTGPGAKLLRDRARLLAAVGGGVPVAQVAVITSAVPIVNAPERWESVLAAPLPPPNLKLSVPLPPSGEALMLFWQVGSRAQPHPGG